MTGAKYEGAHKTLTSSLRTTTWTTTMNKEISYYTVVSSILPFGNHVKKFGMFGSNVNQDFLLKSNVKCLFVSGTMYWL